MTCMQGQFMCDRPARDCACAAVVAGGVGGAVRDDRGHAQPSRQRLAALDSGAARFLVEGGDARAEGADDVLEHAGVGACKTRNAQTSVWDAHACAGGKICREFEQQCIALESVQASAGEWGVECIM